LGDDYKQVFKNIRVYINFCLWNTRVFISLEFSWIVYFSIKTWILIK
jgi:hypothetical protein